MQRILGMHDYSVLFRFTNVPAQAFEDDQLLIETNKT